MKSFVLLYLLICGWMLSRANGEEEKKHYVLYAELLETTTVDIADGAKWIMDKGDTFPVIMFKDGQTKVVLQLAGTNFRVDTRRIKTIEEKEVTSAELETYRKNVQTYLANRSRQWKEQADHKK